MADVVGRSNELATLERLVDSASLGALLLDGPPGIGKSTLWQEGVRLAQERGRRVLAVRPSNDEARLAFAGLSDLLAPALDAALPALPEPQRRALEVALLLRDPGRAPPEERAVLAAFAGALHALAAAGPLLVAIDDAQWLDRPTASALAFALPRLPPDDPLALLVARRSTEEEPPPLGLGRLPADRVTRLEIGRLSLGALSQVLRERLETVVPRPTFLRVYDASGGNPFFALELGRALVARGELRPQAGPLPVPATLRELLHERVAALPAPAAEPLLLLAATGSAPADVIGRALGGEAWERLRPALAAGIVEERGAQLGFTHPLLSSAVYDGADPDLRRRAHRALAAATDQPEERARHLALAATGPDAETAQALEDAAAAAGRRGAGQAVAELLDRAVALTPADDRPALVRRLAAAAEALNSAGDVGRAIALAEDAAEAAASGPERAAALFALARARYRDVAAGEAALAEAGDDRLLRARIQLLLAETGHTIDARHALRRARGAADDARAAGDASLEARALGWAGRLELLVGDGDPLATLERAAALELDGPEPPLGSAVELQLGCVRLARDELELARAAISRQLRLAEERGDLWNRTDFQNVLARLEWLGGEWDRADAYVREAAETWTASGDEEFVNALVWLQALVPAHRGELAAARAILESAPGEAKDPGNRSRNLWILGHVALCEGRFAEAAAHLDRAAELYDEVGLADPGVRLFESDLIEARVAAGRLDDARAEAGTLLARGRELDRPRANAIGLRGLGLVLAAEGRVEAALEPLEQALREHERLTAPFERARTLLALGSVQRRARRRGEARATLREAIAIFEQLGASHWAGRARAELARVGGRAPGDALTVAERRVAELAAEGRSNKEIAAELVVTVKTVEATLSRVYRKLGVRSRAALGRTLAAQSVGESPLSVDATRT